MESQGVFDAIYEQNVWGCGSGHGSLICHTRPYCRFIERFIREKEVATIVDIGCGDWQFSKHIDWGNCNYTGCDVVAKVVEANTQLYSRQNVHFRKIAADASEAPPADLLLMKDVLQHLPTSNVWHFIRDVFPRYRYCLITNCVLPEAALNTERELGDFRPLDLRKPPFGISADHVFTITGPRVFSLRRMRRYATWMKFVLLIRGKE